MDKSVEPIRAAAYIRVSTEDQTEYSPDAQLYGIRQYAERSGMYLDDRFIFRDDGISGRRADKRPGFMRMIQTAKSKPRPFELILVHKFDRFARSREDSIVFKSILRRECGIRVISVSEPMEDEKMSVLMEAVIEAMGEYYSLNLGDEVRKGMTEKARRGELQTPAPFGYRMNAGLLTVYEPEAAVVREIFHQYVHENMTPRAIARYVNLLGVHTIRGNRFEKRNIEYILYNPTYAGMMRWTPTASVCCRHDFDNPETMVLPARHEPVIDEAVFTAANAKLRLHTRTRGKYQRGEITTHWLQGVLRCGECLATLSYGRAYNGRTPAYRCSRYLNGGCGSSQRIAVDKVEAAVLEALQSDSLVCRRRFERAEKPQTADLTLLRRQLDGLEAKLARARELALSGIDTPDEYRKTKADIVRDRESLLARLRTSEKPKPAAEEIGSIVDLLISEKATLSEKNQAVKELVRQIVYDKKNDTLHIYYCSPTTPAIFFQH